MRDKFPPPPAAGDVYVLVADAGRARIFAATAGDGRLDELADLVNPQIRLRRNATESDDLGRTVNSLGGARHAVEPHQTPHQHHKEAFARQVAEFLEHARRERRISRLYLVAEPAFLGLLRQSLPENISRLVVGELAKSLPHARPEEIRQALPSQL